MANYTLSRDGGHVFVGLMDALAAVESERKGDSIGKIARVGRSQLIVGGHGSDLRTNQERERVAKQDVRPDEGGGKAADKKPRPEGDTGARRSGRSDSPLVYSAHEIRRPGNWQKWGSLKPCTKKSPAPFASLTSL
jgi:hypothetical protein